MLWAITNSTANAQSAAALETSTSSQSSSEPEKPLYPSRDMRDKTLLAEAVNDQAQWLDTPYGKILALYRQTEAKTTHGVLILLHAAESPQSWPAMLENLRSNLPRYGWETLAVSLPQKYTAQAPRRESSSSATVAVANSESSTSSLQPIANTVSSASSSIAIPREDVIKANVEAALAFMQTKGKLNVVILVDNSAAYLSLQNLLPQVKENTKEKSPVEGPLQALIIANLQPQEPVTKTELDMLFSQKILPVLDIFFVPENDEQKAQRDLHRASALRNKMTLYQQNLIDNQPQVTETDAASFLVGRIRGFMQQHAKGKGEQK